MISSGDIKYLAGLWEGEGCFLRVGKTPGMSLLMTDKDVIEFAARLMGYQHTIYTRPLLPNRKTVYQFRLPTSLSVQWMMTLFPLLGQRRRARIKQLLTNWKTTRLPAHLRRECPRGHAYVIRLDGTSRRRCYLCEKAASLHRRKWVA